jgi:hypothetical protein
MLFTRLPILACLIYYLTAARVDSRSVGGRGLTPAGCSDHGDDKEHHTKPMTSTKAPYPSSPAASGGVTTRYEELYLWQRRDRPAMLTLQSVWVHPGGARDERDSDRLPLGGSEHWWRLRHLPTGESESNASRSFEATVTVTAAARARATADITLFSS